MWYQLDTIDESASTTSLITNSLLGFHHLQAQVIPRAGQPLILDWFLCRRIMGGWIVRYQRTI